MYNPFFNTFQDQNFLASLILATHATYPTHTTFLDFVIRGDEQNCTFTQDIIVYTLLLLFLPQTQLGYFMA